MATEDDLCRFWADEPMGPFEADEANEADEENKADQPDNATAWETVQGRRKGFRPSAGAKPTTQAQAWQQDPNIYGGLSLDVLWNDELYRYFATAKDTQAPALAPDAVALARAVTCVKSLLLRMAMAHVASAKGNFRPVILDVGCGRNSVFRILAGGPIVPSKVVALDVSRTNLERAWQVCSQLKWKYPFATRFVQHDLSRPLPQSEPPINADVAMIFFTLQYLFQYDPQSLDRFPHAVTALKTVAASFSDASNACAALLFFNGSAVIKALTEGETATIAHATVQRRTDLPGRAFNYTAPGVETVLQFPITSSDLDFVLARAGLRVVGRVEGKSMGKQGTCLTLLENNRFNDAVKAQLDALNAKDRAHLALFVYVLVERAQVA